MACTLDSVGAIFTHSKDWDKRTSSWDKVGGFLNGRLFSTFSSANGRDKWVKLLKSLTQTIAVISEKVNGQDHKVTIEAGRVSSAAGTARDVFGLFNVLGGVLTGIYYTIQNLGKLLTQQGDIDLSKKSSGQPKDQLEKVKEGSHFQKFLAIIEHVGRLVASVSFSVAFAVCRVIKFCGKVIVGKLSTTAQKVVNAFAAIMFANHIGAFLENAAALWRKTLRLNQIQSEPDYKQDHNTAYAGEYTQAVFSHSCSLLEKGLELVCDANAVFSVAIPPVAVAAMGLFGSFFGLVKVWVGGYEAPKI